MKKHILILSSIAFIISIIAFTTVDYDEKKLDESNLLFSQLSNQLDAITKIKIEKKKESFSVKKTDNQWVMESKDSFPVPLDKVKTNLIAISEIKLVEQKTNNPDNFHLLGLQDLNAASKTEQSYDKQPKIITLYKNDTVQAKFILGEHKLSSPDIVSFYVRTPKENQTWLAESTSVIGTNSSEWLNKKIIDIPKTDIKSVHLKNKKKALVIRKLKDNSEDFTLKGMGKKEKLKSQYIVNSIAQSLKSLEFEDVQSKTKKEIQKTTFVRKIVFQTKRGIEVSINLFKFKGKDDVWSDFSFKTIQKSPDQKTIDFAQEKQIKLSPWIFKLSSWTTDKLLKSRKDLVEKK